MAGGTNAFIAFVLFYARFAAFANRSALWSFTLLASLLYENSNNWINYNIVYRV